MKFLIKIFLLLFIFNNPVFAKQCIMGELDRYNNTKKFDLKKYRKLVEKNTRVYFDKYGNKVETYPLDGGEYRQLLTIIDSPYLAERRYDKNGKLYFFSKEIKGMKFGKSKLYDKNTWLLTIHDMDKDYKFSLCDLVQKIATEYSANIENDNILFSIGRAYDSENYQRYIYEVIVKQPDHVTLIEYIIDGMTGEVLSIVTSSIIDYMN